MSEWQPIETAPEDVDVHVWARGYLVPVPAVLHTAAYYEREYDDPNYMEAGWYPSYAFLFNLPEVKINPTHWMPIPATPASRPRYAPD